MLDNITQLAITTAIVPQVATDDTLIVGQTIDTKGVDGVGFAINTGTLADAGATFTPTLYEGNASNMSDETAVTDTNAYIGTIAAFTQASDIATPLKIGYLGIKRYLRLKLQPAGNASSAPVSAVAILTKKKVGTI